MHFRTFSVQVWKNMGW